MRQVWRAPWSVAPSALNWRTMDALAETWLTAKAASARKAVVNCMLTGGGTVAGERENAVRRGRSTHCRSDELKDLEERLVVRRVRGSVRGLIRPRAATGES